MTIVEKLKKWLNAHPYWAGALTAAEGAASGAVVDLFANPQAFTKAGLHQTLVTIGGATVIALRNYFKTAPRTEWTSIERAARTGGDNVVAETTVVTVDASSSATPTPKVQGGLPNETKP